MDRGYENIELGSIRANPNIIMETHCYIYMWANTYLSAGFHGCRVILVAIYLDYFNIIKRC
jgi:hypothetical protein